MALSALTISSSVGVNYTATTDSSVDWTAVTNNSYFYDKTTKLAYYKTSDGIVVGAYDTFTGGTVNGLTANTISATTYQNLPVSGLTEGNNINISGSNGNFTISVTGITGGSTFTGGTVSGATNFTNGLTANTISATTYQNLPVSGLTEGNNINISGSNGNFTISVTGITQGLSGDYLPLSGGTVTGNTFFTSGLTVNTIDFNTTATTTSAVGRLRWNDTDGTLDIGLKGGNVNLQIGQEQVARVVNKTGSNLLESQYRVVRIRSVSEGGSQGQRLAVVLAQADNDANSVDTLGIVTENIDDNQEGFITTSGLVNGIDTTGSLQGETWLDGDLLYLSPTTPGVLTKVKPIAPQHTIIMGYVVHAHINQGKIFVKVDNGYELDELHNVRIISPLNNDRLVYNSSTSVWENKPVASGTTGTVISFDESKIYNSVASPATGNITDDLTNSRIGIVQKIYHNDSVTPTVPAGWVKLGSGTYTISTLNIIYAEWVSGTRVEYWIVKGV